MEIPVIKGDSTLDISGKGYTFVSEKCRELNSDIFLTRILFKKTICMRGPEAAGLFYDTQHFERKNVAPNIAKYTLFGHGGIQNLDGNEHKNRKKIFMSIMSRENINRLTETTINKWTTYAEQWEGKDRVVLFKEVQKLIFEAVCDWAGVPVSKEEVNRRAGDMGAMIDGAGVISSRHWKGRIARIRTEKWIGGIIKKIRSGDEKSQDKDQLNAAEHFAWSRNSDGVLIDNHIATVGIMNILRPTVAVARYITFAALALHAYPKNRSKIRDDDEHMTFFVNEVRRYYPFFPFVVARVKQEFEWKGYLFPRGINVLLDLYGTNHHPDVWVDPGKFRPERFLNRNTGPFDYIPQGGGDFHSNHRCAGEELTIELLKASIRFLIESVRYDVPRQNLKIELSRIPAIPKSRFVIENVKRIKTEKFHV